MTRLAPWSADFTAGQVAFGEYSSVTSGVYLRARAAAERASLRYRSVAAPAGPTMTTTLGIDPAAWALGAPARTPAAGTTSPARISEASSAAKNRLTTGRHSC